MIAELNLILTEQRLSVIKRVKNVSGLELN